MRRAALVLVLTILACPFLHAVSYPQVALGGGYDCVIMLTNKLATPFEGSLALRRGNSEPWDTPYRVNGQPGSGSSIDVNLPAFGSTKLVLQGESTVSIGHLEVLGHGANSGTDVAVAFFYNFSSAGRLVDSIGVPAGGLSRGHMFAVCSQSTSLSSWATRGGVPSWGCLAIHCPTDSTRVNARQFDLRDKLAGFGRALMETNRAENVHWNP